LSAKHRSLDRSRFPPVSNGNSYCRSLQRWEIDDRFIDTAGITRFPRWDIRCAENRYRRDKARKCEARPLSHQFFQIFEGNSSVTPSTYRQGQAIFRGHITFRIPKPSPNSVRSFSVATTISERPPIPAHAGASPLKMPAATLARYKLEEQETESTQTFNAWWGSGARRKYAIRVMSRQSDAGDSSKSRRTAHHLSRSG